MYSALDHLVNRLFYFLFTGWGSESMYSPPLQAGGSESMYSPPPSRKRPHSKGIELQCSQPNFQ